MPSIASETLTARVPHEYMSRITYEAKQRGVSRNALLNELIGAFCAKRGQETAEDTGILDGAPTELYGVALTLTDDLVRAGYPDAEIRNAFTNIRNEML